MSLLLDFFLILFATIFTMFGYKKGFAESVLGFVRSVMALTIATYLSSALAVAIYNNFLRQAIAAKITENLNNSAHASVEGLMGIFPHYLTGVMPYFGITSEKLNLILNSGCTEKITTAACNLLAPVYIYSIRTVLFILFSTIIYTGFGFLRKIIRKIVKIPVLSQINSVFGAILGFLEYIVLTVLILVACRLALPMLETRPAILSEETINKTIIFKEIYYHNPVVNFFEPLFPKDSRTVAKF